MSTREGMRYGVGFSFAMPLIQAGLTDYATSAEYTYAAGDVKVIIDQGTPANITTTPTYIASGNTWLWALTDAEMVGSEIVIVIVDSATKAIEDDQFTILTEAHNHRIITLSGTPTSTSMVTDLVETVDDFHKNSIGKFITGALSANNLSTGSSAQGLIDGYTGSSKTLTFATGELPTAPASGDKLILINS